jgi:16S rRNA (guanine1516-N2)-methyltransferase
MTDIPFIDFLSDSLTYRRKFGGGKNQSLAKACGIQKGYRTLIDATAGLGEDGFILAALGFQVTLLERNSLIFQALTSALEKARESTDKDILEILDRLSLHEGDAKILIPKLPPADVILLDPMFPEREKSALVKKPMQLMKALVGEDEDSDELLPIALQHAIHRVVVKRSKRAPHLNHHIPDFQLLGKSSRWDGYNTFCHSP